jgi:periplasmic protein TonB
VKNLIFIVGLMLDFQAYAQYGTSKDFCPYRSEPEFIDGQAALFKFIRENLVYPKDSSWEDFRAYVGFTIETDGRLTAIHLKRTNNKALGEAALQMMQKMPKWKPAKCLETNQPIKMPHVIPIRVRADWKQ